MNNARVWTIAGLDSTGLAGILLDLETCKHFNVEGCAVVTAVAEQKGIESLFSEHIAEQCALLAENKPAHAIKIGMLGSCETHETLVNFLTIYSGPVILDPVLYASSGASLIFSELSEHIQSLKKLLPYVDLITPNRFEAEHILNRSINSYSEVEEAAYALLELGASNVLIKGGHIADSLFSQDFWTNGIESFWMANHRAPEKNYRGTGCMLSSAIAACLALGYCLKDALVIAKMYVNRGIRKAIDIGGQSAKLTHGSWPEEQIDLPYLSTTPIEKKPKIFPPCNTGLYPVVDSSSWIPGLAQQGVKNIQLRIKEASSEVLEQEIKQGILLAKEFGVTLFINDYWELALRLGAEAVHLGQEDLQEANITAIYEAGLYLGISTHCYYEVARAHTLSPSYIACGPIYSTTSKIMSFEPQGIAQLNRWRRTLSYPLVAIGGINGARMGQVANTGVEGISMISAITKATNPWAATRKLLKMGASSPGSG